MAFVNKGDDKKEFLNKVKSARAERNAERERDKHIISIQALARGFISRRRLNKDIRREVDDLLCMPDDASMDYKPTLKSGVHTYNTLKKFLFVLDEKTDMKRFEYMCKYIIASIGSDSIPKSYAGVGMMRKQLMLPWIQQVKSLVWRACLYLKILKPESVSELRMIQTCLVVIITFTSCNTWKILTTKEGSVVKGGMVQLCNNIMGHLTAKGLYPVLQHLLIQGLSRAKPVFKPTSLSAIITVALRPLIASGFSENLMTLFLLHILSVPAVVHYIITMSQECTNLLITERIFKRSIDLLANPQSTKIVFNALEGSYALCLLANLIQLGDTELEGLVEKAESFMVVVSKLLEKCSLYVQGKKSNLTHWHPVLGWFSQKTDQRLFDSMTLVVDQVQLLWSPRMIRMLFDQLFTFCDLHQQKSSAAAKRAAASGGASAAANSGKKKMNILQKALTRAGMKFSGPTPKLDSALVYSTCRVCHLYVTVLNTLTQLRTDILAKMCYRDILLPKLWLLIMSLGPQNGLRVYLDHLATTYTPGAAASSANNTHNIYHLLMLSCDISAHIITILDDVELYEQQTTFTIDNLVAISTFLNHFVFRAIYGAMLDVKQASNDPMFNSTYGLLKILYERDCRRQFAPEGHWLIKDLKVSNFISDLNKNKKHTQFLFQKIPHIIPHKDRVVLFRKLVTEQKELLGLVEMPNSSPTPTYVSVHRPRLVEDGYRQLAALPSKDLKGVIRVKFYNEQGLDEAGIDQDGVFKEFLEETVVRVFDPALNLFKVTSEQKLYPSPTSNLTENYLGLFNFVGKMLGKAVYEGIVVDVPFAPFFLSMICNLQHSTLYSSIDELPSLDPELYKNLTYVKHYDGDIADLDLTFTVDQDVMGRIETHELIPGGKVTAVTNDNKISYVHRMAHFRMRKQIKKQTEAFLQGFQSIVNVDWLAMFSAPELQKLISGDNVNLDLEDLRRHTQYYGGFHSQHKVIKWLWDVVIKEFSVKEKGLFLKFVTSCSKPPLLGFSYLEPPFSIRCVEVSEDQDTGDTVGTVLKGFFSLHKHDPVGRLPTASTCFNLLKLPNYQKRSTLREKLRYAINSNTGFELS